MFKKLYDKMENLWQRTEHKKNQMKILKVKNRK